MRVLNEDGTVTLRDFVPKENTVLLDPDVKVYFPDSESVNRALRSLINLIPEKRQAVSLKVAEDTARSRAGDHLFGCKKNLVDISVMGIK